ncbi:MAG: xylulokinase [Bacillota bacterium]
MSAEYYLLCYDIGSTSVKLTLFDNSLNLFYTAAEGVPNYQDGGHSYQKAEDWWRLVKSLTKNMLDDVGIVSEQIKAIGSTGQMEDCLLLNEKGQPLTEVLLYSDGRARNECQLLIDKYSHEKLSYITGNKFNPLMSINKYLWFRNNRKGAFAKHRHVVLGSKDYINFKLTGHNISDYTNASTTGFLDINEMKWNEILIEDLGFDGAHLPQLEQADRIIGRIKPDMAAELGLSPELIVVNGSGDVGASTLGAGALTAEEIYCYLGTTGWLAMPAEEISANKNLFTLSNLKGGSYIIAGAVLNAGRAYDWFLSNIMNHEQITEEVYSEVEAHISKLDARENRTIFIPYLAGERSPLKIEEGNGVFAQLGYNTNSWDLLLAVLEGVGFSLKANLVEMVGGGNLSERRLQINLVGGGSKSDIWPQLLANILESQVNILEIETGAPSLGAAMICLKAVNEINDYTELEGRLNVTQSYKPQMKLRSHYVKKYERYQRLVSMVYNI